jgi:hypothetical protein
VTGITGRQHEKYWENQVELLFDLQRPGMQQLAPPVALQTSQTEAKTGCLRKTQWGRSNAFAERRQACGVSNSEPIAAQASIIANKAGKMRRIRRRKP